LLFFFGTRNAPNQLRDEKEIQGGMQKYMITGKNVDLVKSLNQFASLMAALTHQLSAPAKALAYGYSDHQPTQKKSYGRHLRRKSCRTECCVASSGQV
jgi:hypothetical protein